jgi:hypothetical protein
MEPITSHAFNFKGNMYTFEKIPGECNKDFYDRCYYVAYQQPETKKEIMNVMRTYMLNQYKSKGCVYSSM